MKRYQELEFELSKFEEQDVVMASSIESQNDTLVFDQDFVGGGKYED